MEREAIHEKCIGCKKVDADNKCSVYLKPLMWWRIGGCPIATHIEKEIDKTKGKVRVGQQKQKKHKK